MQEMPSASVDTAYLIKRVSELREALEAVFYEIENCDWRCAVCNSDPRMIETDMANMVAKALGYSIEAMATGRHP